MLRSLITRKLYALQMAPSVQSFLGVFMRVMVPLYVAVAGMTIVAVAVSLWVFAPLPNGTSTQLAEQGESVASPPSRRIGQIAAGISAPRTPVGLLFDGDPELGQAARTARETRGKFDEAFAQGQPGRYSVKVVLNNGSQSESVWIRVERMRDGDYVGKIANKPDRVTFVREDQDIQVAPSEIVDWMIQRGDAIFGAYTTRVILSRSTDEEAKSVLEVIQDL